MEDTSLAYLFGSLAFLVLLSGYFSSSETGMMALNRYRLRHLADAGDKSAMRVQRLLDRPDRLIGVILLGNNLVNILAASIATVIGLRLFGEAGIAIASLALTVIILIFGEVAPKTMAALYPERIAYPTSYILGPLLKITYPIVWALNGVANGILKAFGVNLDDKEDSPMTREELRSVVRQAGTMIPKRHQRMLLAILDLENMTVNDIMIRRGEITGIDLDDDIDEIHEMLNNCRHTRLPVYRGNLDNTIGVLHVRRLLRSLIEHEEITKETIEASVSEPFFVPEDAPLNTQMVNFQRNRQRLGLVVDEYGMVLGLVTLEDMLEEIVGEFTTDTQTFVRDIHPQNDGTYLIDATANIRDINRQLHWRLPVSGPRTLNGLILEHLESIPESGTSLRIHDYAIEITQTTENAVKTARLWHLNTANNNP
ncbi:MAG: HlyC/CorC family transporter [Gammaproteobacteria bacterium]